MISSSKSMRVNGKVGLVQDSDDVSMEAGDTPTSLLAEQVPGIVKGTHSINILGIPLLKLLI